MFFVWGSKWSYKVKADGLRVGKLCPECDKRGEFYEVIPTKYFCLFWIPMVPTTTRKPLLECPNCHERYYIQTADYLAAIKSLPKPKAKSVNVINLPHSEDDNSGVCITLCGNCGQKLKVPKNDRTLRVTCPKCKNDFTFKNGQKI